VAIYAAITGIILKRTTTAAESGWEEGRYVSIRGRRHGETEMRGGEITAGGRYGWGGSV